MPRPTKRQKVSVQTEETNVGTALTTVPKRKPTARGRRGALKNFPEMPLDILIQVSPSFTHE